LLRRLAAAADGVVRVPRGWGGERIVVRVDAATHRAVVWLGDTQVAEHEGGYTPFEADVTEQVRSGGEARLTVVVNTELRWQSIPPGFVQQLEDGRLVAVLPRLFQLCRTASFGVAARHPRTYVSDVVADLAQALRDARAGADGLSFVAEADGRPIGHVQLSRCWLDAPERLVEVAVLSPLSVLPGYRRRGIGGRLVEHAVRAADGIGMPMVFLEGSPSFYGRLGFRAAGPLGFTARRCASRTPRSRCTRWRRTGRG
jgi:predicted N-acetyltransferase YhbS